MEKMFSTGLKDTAWISQEPRVALSFAERAAWSCTLGCRFFSGLLDCVVTQEDGSACYCHFWLLILCCWWEANRTTWVLLLFCTCVALGHSPVPVSLSSWAQPCRARRREPHTMHSCCPRIRFLQTEGSMMVFWPNNKMRFSATRLSYFGAVAKWHSWLLKFSN